MKKKGFKYSTYEERIKRNLTLFVLLLPVYLLVAFLVWFFGGY